jgi:hypothetical protein
VVKLQIDPNVEKLKLINSLTKKKNPEHRSDRDESYELKVEALKQVS